MKRITSPDGSPISLSLPRSDKPKYSDTGGKITPGDAICLSDIHAPFHDAEFIYKVLEVGMAWDVSTIVLNGDLWDLSSFSSFASLPEDLWEDDAMAVEGLIAGFANAKKKRGGKMVDAFDSIFMLMGNHSFRFMRQTLRQISLTRMMRMVADTPKLTTCPYKKASMETPRGRVMFVHPRNTSKFPGVVPQRLQQNHWPDCHIVGGHGHLRGLIWSADGKKFAMDAGMCADPARIEYTMTDASAYPQMLQGAAIIKNGHPYLLYPECDWTRMESLYRT